MLLLSFLSPMLLQKDALCDVLFPPHVGGPAKVSLINFSTFNQVMKPLDLRVRVDDVVSCVLDALLRQHQVFVGAAAAEFAQADADHDGWLSEIEFVR